MMPSRPMVSLAARPIRRWLGAGLALALLLAVSAAETATEPLGRITIPVVTLELAVDTRPDVDGLQSTVTAIKDVPTAIHTRIGLPGHTAVAGLPEGALVKAELRGPAFADEAITLSALPNRPFEVQGLRLPGDYLLSQVRLEGPDGARILERDPAAEPVVISVIDELLVTQVTSRALSAEEIEAKGIVIDEDNFTAFNFTVGLTLGSEQVEVDLPVVIPTTAQALTQVEQPETIRLPTVQRAFDRVNIPNFSLTGFQLRPPPELEEEKGLQLPPINGVIVIPGNIGFLNQFFSVVLQATNVAPQGSDLVLHGASAHILLPGGGDDMLGTGDDPLRMAETRQHGVREALPLLGPAGQGAISPEATHHAEFLVEGVREGTHSVRFDITGDLYVPALGERVPLTGKAAGLVQVKNPTFGLSLAHPDVVREGEAYSIFATVTNTSKSPANFFQLALNARSLSGARLADGEAELKTQDSLAPGEAHSFEFRMVAETTGEVTGTVFLADAGVNGSFVLTTGVGDTGIPFSPDTLVLPKSVDYLPKEPAMLFQAVRLLGQAYSVATAPAGTLPPAIPRVSKGFVFDRAVKLAQAGLHVRFGEPPLAAARDVLMDYLGAPGALTPEGEAGERRARDWAAFDTLRRAAGAGHDFVAVLAELLGAGLGDAGLGDLQRAWAEAFASRPAHLSIAAESRGPPVRVRLIDGEGRALGALDPAQAPRRELPFGARLPLATGGGASSELLLVTRPGAGYRLELKAPEATELALALVVPSGEGMSQLRYPAIALGAGGSATLSWAREGEPPLLVADLDGGGGADRDLAPVAVPIADPPPQLVGVQQWAKGSRPMRTPSFEHGDPLGRVLGLLFSEEVDPETAGDPMSYQVADNRVRQVALQPDARLAFVVLERPVGPFVPRELRVEGIADLAGQVLATDSQPIRGDPERGLAGSFRGQVVSADGRPVPFATVRYIQPLEFPAVLSGGCAGASDVRDFEVASYQADAQGRFTVDYILAAELPPGCPSNPDVWLNENSPGGTANFKLEALDPETGEVGKASSRIHFDAQAMGFKVIIRGYGAIAGTLYDEDGQVIVGGDPGTPEALTVHARNISTGERYASWVDGEGRYAFPRRYEGEGTAREAPRVAVGNLILRVARPDGYTAVTTANLPAAGSRTTQDLLLVAPNRYGTVRGRVLEAGGGRGAAHVPVQVAGRVLSRLDLYERGYSSGVIGATVTDAEGFFELEQVPVGDIRVRAVRQSTYEQADARAYLEAAETARVNLVFPGTGGTVRGVVRDGLGRLVAGAQVAAGPTLTETDEAGRFEVHHLPLGKYTIQAQGPDSPALGEVRVESLGPDDVQEVVITLEPLGSVAGTVFRADGKTPVPRQKVQLWLEPDRGVLAEAYTTVEGAFAFDQYPVGDYSVRAVEADRGDGGMTYTRIRYAGDRRDADIVYRGLGSVSGRVVQAGAGPQVADVVIRRKVWRVLTEADRERDNVFVQAMRAVQEQLGEEDAERIEQAMLKAGLTRPSGEFFVLTDETARRSSKSLDAEGRLKGRFRFARVLAGPFKVAAFGSFLAPAEVRGEIPNTRDPARRAVELGDLELTPATASLHGTVYLPGGEPAGQGVKVTVRSLDSSGNVFSPSEGGGRQPVLPEYSVRTGPRGRYDLPLVLRGRFVLSADTGVPQGAAGSAEALRLAGEGAPNVRLYARASGSVPAGEDLAADLHLQAVGEVQVRVVGADGKPVPRARVSLATASTLDADEEAGFQRLHADPGGRIELFPVIAGPFSVSARHPEHAARGQANGLIPEAGGEVVPVTVTLGAVTTAEGEVLQAAGFGTVAGQVLKADGEPLTHPAQVTVRARRVEVLTTTDAQGRYRAEDVPTGPLQVEAFEPYTARRGSAGARLEGQGQAIEVAVRLVGLGTVSGTVWGSDGERRRPGLDVLLYPAGRYSDRLITRSDPAGAYTLPGVPEGRFRLAVTDHETGLRGEASGAMPTDEAEVTTDLRLEPAGGVAGVVYAAGVRLDAQGRAVDAEGRPLGEPPVVANARVEVRGPRTSQVVQSDTRGRFATAEVLPLGDYRISARPPAGNDGAVREATIEHDDQVVELPVVLAGTGIVEGVVLDSQGERPVPLARITLVSRSPFSGGPVTRMSEGDGRFRFEGVPVGHWSLELLTTVGEPRLGGAASGRIEHHGQVLALDGEQAVSLEPAGSIRGQALLPDGQTPAPGTVAELAGERLRLARVADEAGRFAFEAVPLGLYRLRLNEPERNALARAEVRLTENGEGRDLGALTLDGEPPRVVDSTPAPGSSRVPTDRPLLLELSEALDPASVGPDSVQVLVAGRQLAGELALVEGRRIRFTPDRPLPDLVRVQLRLKAHRLGFEGQVLARGVQDLAGRGLPEDFELAFTTADTTAPELVRTSPRHGASGVDPRQVLRLVFSEPVDPTSVKAVTLRRGDQALAGRLNEQPIQGGKILVFSPSEPLQANSRYTATLQGPVKDLAGNPMAEAGITLSFATFDTLPPRVEALALPEQMAAVEGKTVPVQVAVSGEDVAMVECYRGDELVGSDATAPYVCPVTLDPALGARVRVSAMAVDRAGNRSQRAYLPLTIEANRSPEVGIAAPEEMAVSAGQTITVRVAARDDVALRRVAYTANGGRVASAAQELADLSAAEARFSFEVPYDFPVGEQVVLEAMAEDRLGLVARSAPVRLRVSGQMPPRVRLSGLARNAAVDPGAKLVLMSTARHGSGIRELSLSAKGAFSFAKTLTVMPARPEAEGRFVVRVPEDVSPKETVTLTARAVDTRGSGGTTSISLRISDRTPPAVALNTYRDRRDVEPGTSLRMWVKASDEMGVRRVRLAVERAGEQARVLERPAETSQRFDVAFPGDIPLGSELTVLASAEDQAGNVGEARLTLTARDLRGPKVSILEPARRTVLRAGETVTVAAEAEDPFGVAALALTTRGVTEGTEEQTPEPAEQVSGRFQVSVPEAAIGGGDLHLKVAATDQAGNIGRAGLRLKVRDEVRPRVESIQPADGADGVLPSRGLRLAFTEGIKRSSFTPETLSVEGPDGEPVPGRAWIGYYSDSGGFDPEAPWRRGATYQVRVTEQVTDWSGNPLEPFTATFTTDGTGPRLVELSPARGETGISARPTVRARFDEPLARETVTGEHVRLLDPAGAVVPAKVKAKGHHHVLELIPKAPLAFGQTYTVSLASALTDAAGNPITDAKGQAFERYESPFTTGALRLVSPAGPVLEHAVVALEALSEGGLSFPRVRFEVNGKALRPVPGPPYRVRHRVAARRVTPELEVATVALDEAGEALARTVTTLPVRPALRPGRSLVGVPEGGRGTLVLRLSEPLPDDLPVTLSVAEAAVVALGAEAVTLAAGETRKAVSLRGLSPGRTRVVADSSQGTAQAVVTVSSPVRGQALALASQAAGLSVGPARALGTVVLPTVKAQEVVVPLLVEPAGAVQTVTVANDAPAVLRAPAEATVAAGSHKLSLRLEALQPGRGTLTLRHGGRTSKLAVEVAPEEPTSVATSPLLSLAIRPLPLLGELQLQPGAVREVSVHLPGATGPGAVRLRSHRPQVVQVPKQVAAADDGTVEVSLTAREAGEALVELDDGDRRWALAVRVGAPRRELAARNQVAGLALRPAAFAGELRLPRQGERTLLLPLLAEPAAEALALTVASSDPTVVAAPERVTVPAGSRLASLTLTAGRSGAAELRLAVAGRVTRVPVRVGVGEGAAHGAVGGLGLSVRPPGTAGRVYLGGQGRTTVALPVLARPVGQDTAVTLTSRHPNRVELASGAVTVPAGQRHVPVTFIAHQRMGVAVVDVHSGGEHRTLEVVLGSSEAGPAVAPAVGLEVK